MGAGQSARSDDEDQAIVACLSQVDWQNPLLERTLRAVGREYVHPTRAEFEVRAECFTEAFAPFAALERSDDLLHGLMSDIALLVDGVGLDKFAIDLHRRMYVIREVHAALVRRGARACEARAEAMRLAQLRCRSEQADEVSQPSSSFAPMSHSQAKRLGIRYAISLIVTLVESVKNNEPTVLIEVLMMFRDLLKDVPALELASSEGPDEPKCSLAPVWLTPIVEFLDRIIYDEKSSGQERSLAIYLTLKLSVLRGSAQGLLHGVIALLSLDPELSLWNEDFVNLVHELATYKGLATAQISHPGSDSNALEKPLDSPAEHEGDSRREATAASVYPTGNFEQNPPSLAEASKQSAASGITKVSNVDPSDRMFVNVDKHLRLVLLSMPEPKQIALLLLVHMKQRAISLSPDDDIVNVGNTGWDGLTRIDHPLAIEVSERALTDLVTIVRSAGLAVNSGEAGSVDILLSALLVLKAHIRTMALCSMDFTCFGASSTTANECWDLLFGLAGHRCSTSEAGPSGGVSDMVQREGLVTIAYGFEVFFPSFHEQAHFVTSLLLRQQGSSLPNLTHVEQKLLQLLQARLTQPGPVFSLFARLHGCFPESKLDDELALFELVTVLTSDAIRECQQNLEDVIGTNRMSTSDPSGELGLVSRASDISQSSLCQAKCLLAPFLSQVASLLDFLRNVGDRERMTIVVSNLARYCRIIIDAACMMVWCC